MTSAYPRGKEIPSAKLTESEVLEIRRLAAERVKLMSIAAQFGISASHCSQIVRRKAWAWL